MQAGLFAASPQYVLGSQGFANNTAAGCIDTRVTATFDHVSLTGGRPGGTWTASRKASPPVPQPGTGGQPGRVPLHRVRTPAARSLPRQVHSRQHGAGSIVSSGGTYTVTAERR